jgi:excisionase family DNA binding protein
MTFYNQSLNENEQLIHLIMMDTATFYSLVKEVTDLLLSEKAKDKKWLTLAEAKSLLAIKSSTTILKLRDTGSIRFSKFGRKILYDRKSIMEYLEKNINETF